MGRPATTRSLTRTLPTQQIMSISLAILVGAGTHIRKDVVFLIVFVSVLNVLVMARRFLCSHWFHHTLLHARH